MKTKYRWVCERCGKDDLTMSADGEWNTHEQEFDWYWNSTYCNDCEDEVYTIMKVIPQIPKKTKII